MSNDFAKQLEAVAANLRQHETAMLTTSREALDDVGADGKVYMRANAPWTDRTGQARFGADADANPAYAASPLTIGGRGLTDVPLHPEQLREGGAVAFIQDAPYGRILETANGGDYSILPQTLAVMGVRLMAALKALWR
jgi:hypothetical protein